MRTIKNIFRIYKADGSEIVDCTNEVESFTENRGSVSQLGDGFTDNPVQTLDLTLKNTNEKLYSPHFKANKVKFNDNYLLQGNGGVTYGSPFSNTILVVSLDSEYRASWIKGNIVFNKSVPAGVQVRIAISYIDTQDKNPINHLNTSDIQDNWIYAPLIQERNTIEHIQQIIENRYTDTQSLGTGTNQVQVNFQGVLSDYRYLKIKKVVGRITKQELFNLTKEKVYLLIKERINGKNIETTKANVVSYTINSKGALFTFDRVIESNEIVFFSILSEFIVEENLNFVGRITNSVTSNIESCSFQAIDLAYDLQHKKIYPYDFRNYFTEKDELGNIYTLVEECTNVTVTDNSITAIYNNLINCVAVGDIIYLFNGTDYIAVEITGYNFLPRTKQYIFGFTKAVIDVTTKQDLYYDVTQVYDLTFTVVDPEQEVTNGTYSIFTKYNPSFSLETFIQNCLEDTGVGYDLFVQDFSDFSIIPKVADLQYNNLWSYLQQVVAIRGMILGFFYTDSSKTYYKSDGTTKQGTDSFELVLRSIPQTLDNPKFFISEKDIDADNQFDSTGLRIISSYSIKYLSAETDEVEQIIVDDFNLSIHQATIPTEKNIVITDQLLEVNDTIRIGLEYRKVINVIDSQTYVVNLPFAESTTSDLYTSGDTTNKYGLRQAYIELDNTSEIDTLEEAKFFGELLLNQNLDIYATYRFKVLTKNFYNIQNFDTLRINSPRHNLLYKDLFVQSVQEDANFTIFTVSEIMNIGKYKYYRMRVEKGNDTIYKSDNIDTNDIFPPVTNLKALSPAIDNVKGYQVYTRLSWNKLVGRNVTQYEVQYKKQSENWEQSEVITLRENSLKIVLTEQAIYDIRVRATGKEQVKGNWSYTTVDSTIIFKNNPIRDGIWYIELDELNDVNAYFSILDTYNLYNNNYSEIKVIPSGSNNVNVYDLLEKIEIKNDNFGKKIVFLDFAGFYTLDRQKDIRKYTVFKTENKAKFKFIDISSTERGILFDSNVAYNSEKFRAEMSGFDFFIEYNIEPAFLSRAIIQPYRYTSDIFKNPSRQVFNCNIKINSLPPNFAPFVFMIEDCESSFGINLDLNSINTYSSSIFYKCDNIKNIFITNAPQNSIIGNGWVGFSNCNNVSECELNGYYTTSFSRCNKLKSNKAGNTSNVSTKKYDNCYASESNDTTYLIADNGSDTANGGFNT